MTQLQTMDKIEQVLAMGQLQSLSAKERVDYLKNLCEMIGLNPLTKPFEFITFQGKTVPYATRGCTDQLRKINGVSIRITDKSFNDGTITVVVEATDKTGRVDSDIGVVFIGPKASPADKANAFMKAITKAKRRVTLSICGLGFLDESEIETVPGIKTVGNETIIDAPSLEAPVEANQYVVKDGKYAGKKLIEIPSKELEGYLLTIGNMLAGKQQETPEWFSELKDNYEQLK